MLSGVSLVNYKMDDYDDEYSQYEEAVLLTIDGKNYIAMTDPDDGYRSYGCFFETEKYRQTNAFPPQRVFVKNIYDTSFEEESQMYYQYEGIEIYNMSGENILRVGTDISDAYYPMACFKYNPQNLPINKQVSDADEIPEDVDPTPTPSEPEYEYKKDHDPRDDFYEYLDRYGSGAFVVAIIEMLKSGELPVTWEQAGLLWERGGKTS